MSYTLLQDDFSDGSLDQLKWLFYPAESIDLLSLNAATVGIKEENGKLNFSGTAFSQTETKNFTAAISHASYSFDQDAEMEAVIDLNNSTGNFSAHMGFGFDFQVHEFITIKRAAGTADKLGYTVDGIFNAVTDTTTGAKRVKIKYDFSAGKFIFYLHNGTDFIQFAEHARPLLKFSELDLQQRHTWFFVLAVELSGECSVNVDFDDVKVEIETAPLKNYYCQPQDVLDILEGVKLPAGTDEKLKNIFIPKAEGDIDRECGQSFRIHFVNEQYDGNTGYDMQLRRTPVLKVSEVVIRITQQVEFFRFRRLRHTNVYDTDGRRISEEATNLTDADLLIDALHGKITIPMGILNLELRAFPFWNYQFLAAGAQNIQVRAHFGYARNNVPDDLRYACASLAAVELLLRRGAAVYEGASQVSIGKFSRAVLQLPYGGLINNWKKDAFNRLQKYKIVYAG